MCSYDIVVSDKAIVISAQNLGSPCFKISEQDIKFLVNSKCTDSPAPAMAHLKSSHQSEAPQMWIVLRAVFYFILFYFVFSEILFMHAKLS